MWLFLFILHAIEFEKSLSAFHPNFYIDDTSIFSCNENALQLLEDRKGGSKYHGLAKTK